MTTKVQAEFLAPGVISDQTQVSAASADHLLIFDASDNSLKKALVSTITDSGTTAADDISAGDAAITISTSSGNITIDNGSSDDDIIFKGTDGGSDITALTLDMSDAGTAIFNKNIKLGHNQYAIFGDDVNDPSMSVYSNGTDGKIDVAGGGLELAAPQGIRFDSNNGSIKLNDGGTEVGEFQLNDTNHLKLGSKVSDADIKFFGNDGGSTITALTLDMSEAGNASFNGTVTANAGLIADNITIDGTEIDLSSGSLTIDVADNIFLDADGGNIGLKDAGTQWGNLANNGGDFEIDSIIQDKDIKFNGNDGGSTITALTLDMSEEGNATFNNNVIFGDNGKAIFGAGIDVALYSDGTNGQFQIQNGSLTIDCGDDINLDADGGTIVFKDGGTEIALLALDNSGYFDIYSSVSDSDIRLRGNDGGSLITALTLDMSEAGAATFNNNVTAYSDERLKSNIETLEDGLAKVEQLRGVTYTRDEKENIGVIAQEVEKILPEIVLTADDEMGTKSVDYSRITAVLIEAVKDLSARVKELENK